MELAQGCGSMSAEPTRNFEIVEVIQSTEVGIELDYDAEQHFLLV